MSAIRNPKHSKDSQSTSGDHPNSSEDRTPSTISRTLSFRRLSRITPSSSTEDFRTFLEYQTHCSLRTETTCRRKRLSFTTNHMIIHVEFRINKQLKIFQRLQIALAFRTRAILLAFEKKYCSCFAPSCTQNYKITYANTVTPYVVISLSTLISISRQIVHWASKDGVNRYK